jgi:hypothetical protein
MVTIKRRDMGGRYPTRSAGANHGGEVTPGPRASLRAAVVYIEPVITPTTEHRWRAFANLVAVALALNVWVSVVLLPAAYADAMDNGQSLAVIFAPLAVLATGVWWRSELVLLLAYPSALLLPLGLHPELASSHVYGPVRFVLVSFGVLAYLFGVSYFTRFHEPPAPVSTRPLGSARVPTPAHWQRRERVYRLWFALALAFPVTLICWVIFAEEVQLVLGENYPGRVELMTTMLTVGVIVLWLGLYHHAFLGALRQHRTGDRDLHLHLATTRRDARGGRPRRRFYVGVALALILMAILVMVRH